MSQIKMSMNDNANWEEILADRKEAARKWDHIVGPPHFMGDSIHCPFNSH